MNTKKLITLTLALMAATLASKAQTIHYVEDGTPATSGAWTQTVTLETALEQAAENDEIWIAEGTYYLPSHGSCTGTQPFRVRDGVTIYGGLEGNEASNYDMSLRDLIGNQSVIDGNGGARVLLRTAATSNAQITLDGLIFQNAQAAISASHANLQVANCSFNSLSGKGGLFDNNNGTTLISDCSFTGNTSQGTGGVLQARNGSVVTVEQSTLSGNTSDGPSTALVFVQNATVNLDYTTVSNNTVESRGGILSVIEQGSLKAKGSTFESNTSSTFKGMAGSLLYCQDNATVEFVSSTFYENSSTAKAGYTDRWIDETPLSTLKVINCSFDANDVEDDGNSSGNYPTPVMFSTVEVKNSVLQYGNTLSHLRSSAQSNNLQLTYSMVQAGETGWGTNLTTNGPGWTGGGDFSIPGSSAAIDAGDPASTTATTSDYDHGESDRLVDGDGNTVEVIDIGAYEYCPGTCNSMPRYAVTEEVEDEAGFARVFPNPSNGEITVEAEAITRITVYNTMGKVIFSENRQGNRADLDLSNQPTGLYFVEVEAEGELEVLKLVIE